MFAKVFPTPATSLPPAAITSFMVAGLVSIGLPFHLS
jgi:hypothetical protein